MQKPFWICRVKAADSRSQWKVRALDFTAVPITGTGALAEKAKTWKVKPIKGIRQFGPVASAEGMSIFVCLVIRVHQ